MNLNPVLTETDAIAYLRTPQAIRDRCHHLLDLCNRDSLQHFSCHLDRLEATADFVMDVTRETYPHLDVPFHSRWRHFDVGGIPRLSVLDNALARLPMESRAKAKLDLAIVSVLLDAGAGEEWKYTDPASGTVLSRSEGLAVASLIMFGSGFFSSDPSQPLRVDAEALQHMTETRLASGFQVSSNNPLVGLQGRLNMLRQLGEALEQQPEYFDHQPARPGNLLDYWASKRSNGQGRTTQGDISAETLLTTVLDGFSTIWPGRVQLGGVNLGDVWPHPALEAPGVGSNLVPFHKLSQWLTYSLVEPLEELGWTVTDLDRLTGLAEYRNGGLFLDMGVLAPKQASVVEQSHVPGSETIVEWRALTLALLDRLASLLRDRLQVSAAEFPLAKVLEGGTWSAGRRIAQQKRPDGSPPISIRSDGTVF